MSMKRRAAASWFGREESGPFTSKIPGRIHCVLSRREQFAQGRTSLTDTGVPYAAAKAGIQILTQVVAAQVGPYGIRVNCIAPEIILTERNRERIPNAQKDSLKELHPLERLGTPEDVAGAALFLASDEASWVTGVVLDIAGGAVMVLSSEHT